MGNYTVYEHVNKENGKKYIGITSSPVSRRWHGGSGYKRCTYFYKAIKKYGWDGFEHNILHEGLTEQKAKDTEVELIKKFNTACADFGYNLTLGGQANIPNEKTREKIRSKLVGVPRSEDTKRKIHLTNMGHVVSDEAREKMKKASTGKTHSLEVKQKISKKMTGIKRTEKEKNHLSEINKKKFVQLDLSGNYIATHTGILSINGFSGQCVSLCLRGKLKAHKGYMWMYYENYIKEHGEAK